MKQQSTYLKSLNLLLLIVFLSGASAFAQMDYGIDSHTGEIGFHYSYKVKPMNYLAEYNKAKEAGKNLTHLLRDELGAGLIFTTGTYRYHYYENDYRTEEPVRDTGFSLNVRPKSAFQVVETSGFPLATLSNDAALLLTYGLSFHFIDWTQPDFNVYGQDRSYGITSICAGVPLSLDYKSGAEALLDRSKRTCFTIGAGVQPMAVYTTIGNRGSETHFKMCPMAKIEFGFATKVTAIKLRASGYLGNFNYFGSDNVPEGYDNWRHAAITIDGKSQLAVALILMPLASKWEDSGWW